MNRRVTKTVSRAQITMQINNAHFHAEGDAAEVTKKFREFMDSVFQPRVEMKAVDKLEVQFQKGGNK